MPEPPQPEISMKFVKLSAISLILAITMGCSTVTPDMVTRNEASFDSSVPANYDQNDSGIIDVVMLPTGRPDFYVISPAARAKYNALQEKYRLHIRSAHDVDLVSDSGIQPYRDQFGNDLFQIKPDYLAYWMEMKDLERNKEPEDSVWAKIKNL